MQKESKTQIQRNYETNQNDKGLKNHEEIYAQRIDKKRNGISNLFNLEQAIKKRKIGKAHKKINEVSAEKKMKH